MPLKLVLRSGDSAAAVAEAGAGLKVHIKKVKEFVYESNLQQLLDQDLQAHAGTCLQQLKATVKAVIEGRQARRTRHVQYRILSHLFLQPQLADQTMLVEMRHYCSMQCPA